MNLLTRWIAVAPLAVMAAVLALALSPAQAFTDSNAELKDAASQRTVQVTANKTAPPPRTAWVPPTAKSLDGFKPALPDDRGAARPATLVKADAPPPVPARR